MGTSDVPARPAAGPHSRLGGFLSTYWTRGTPGRTTPRSLVVFMHRMWLLAFVLKLIGASWDVSWHFKWLRDDLAPPHLINTVGTGIAVGLVLAHSFTGYGTDRRSLRIIQVGTGIFVLAGPIDIINHRLNGLDLTAWSPSHMLLYIGTGIMLAGVLRSWWHNYPRDTDGDISRSTGRPSRGWTAGFVAMWALMFENTFFPTGQQEYGILEVASWFRGQPYGEGELLNFAAEQIGRPVDDIAIEHFSLPIAPWVYPVWGVAVCAAVLVFARLSTGWRWTATAVVAGYVAYRCVIWPLLTFTIFPPSSVPFWLLPVGLAVDLVLLLRINPYLRAVLGAVVVTAVAWGALAVNSLALGTPLALGSWDIAQMRAAFEAGDTLHFPPVSWSSWWLAGLGLTVTWVAVTWIWQRSTGDRPPPAASYAAEPPRDARGILLGEPLDEPDARPARRAAATGERPVAGPSSRAGRRSRRARERAHA
ncbi:hypothetical protein [Nakamurella leprariae]|uniref:Uncharacterized protein n=1 Tax=Nakamurella leprariae TaxID=2803911 RepID=A0A938YH16_9ACTN|nr:hypothetical protein [Nakamurella leprariae]MBM9467969.1 hypothetical protein [Nakamurella leprariae]